MPRKVVTTQFEGRSCQGIQVEIEESTERWSESKLSDGTVIKMKIVPIEAIKLEGKFSQDGVPIYLVKSTNVMSVDAPDEFLRNNQGEVH